MSPTNAPASASTVPAGPGGEVRSKRVVPVTGNIIMPENGSPFETEAAAELFIRDNNLESRIWGVGRAPGGGGFAVITHELMLQKAREAEAAKEAAASNVSKSKPMKFFQVVVSGANNDGKNVTTVPICYGQGIHLVILGQPAIINEAELEVLRHATIDAIEPSDKEDGIPVAVVGKKPRWVIDIQRNDVTMAEVTAYREKGAKGLRAFQEANKTRARTDQQ